MPSERRRRIAIVYDNTLRPDTTGEYCRRSLEGLGHTVSHYLPGAMAEIPPIYDLYLRVDDDLAYDLPQSLRPLAYWGIDTHRDYARRLAYAKVADFVFCAQRNGAARMRMDGLPSARWLPLACDPEIHRRIPGVAKQYDICFVGNTFPGDGERSRLVEWIRATYPRAFVGQAYGTEMARIYTASRLVFNCAIRDDVNMRAFEATACGSLLLTNDLAANGQDLLFTPGIHLVTYRDGEELPGIIQRYLQAGEEREQIAEAGMRHAHAEHTYRRRMGDLLAAVFEGGDLDDKYPVESRASQAKSREGQPGSQATRQLGRTGSPDRQIARLPSENPVPHPPSPVEIESGRPVVSIIIPTVNHLALIQQCVASIRMYTEVPYEILVVDNGSRDGTAAWARGEGLRVIANAENLGFPRACNQGMLAAFGAYLLLLNDDTVVSPGWLSRLLAHAEGDPAVGLVGASTNFAASCQQIPAQYTSHQEFLAFADGIAREHAGQAHETDWLIGLCLLIPRRVMQEIGLLDPRFGLGNFEDNDYCLRVRMAGYRLLWARDVFIHHEGHQSFRELGEGFARLLQHNERLFREKWDLGRYLRPPNGDGRQASRAWGLLQEGRYDEAYDSFEHLVRAEPGNVRALLGLGLAAEGRGVPAAAALAYRAALEISPGDADAARNLNRVTGGQVVAWNDSVAERTQA